MKKELSVNCIGYGVYELICFIDEVSERTEKTIKKMIEKQSNTVYYLKAVYSSEPVRCQVEKVLKSIGYDYQDEYFMLNKNIDGKIDVDLDELLSVIEEKQVVTCSLKNSMISIYEEEQGRFQMNLSLISSDNNEPTLYKMLNHILQIKLILNAEYFSVIYSKKSGISDGFLVDIFKINDFGIIDRKDMGNNCINLIFKKENIKEKILER